MGLVNEVLSDLERRHAAHGAAALRAVPRERPPARALAARIALGIALGGLAFAAAPHLERRIAARASAPAAVSAPPAQLAAVPAPTPTPPEPARTPAAIALPAVPPPAAIAAPDPAPLWSMDVPAPPPPTPIEVAAVEPPAAPRPTAPPPAPADDLAERALAVAARDGAGALPLLERALRRDPGDVAVRIAMSGALVRDGRPGEARALIQHGLARDAENPALREVEARFLVEEGRLDEARSRLEALLAAAGDDAELLALLAAVELRARRPARAAELYRDALRGEPDRAAWWMGLGLALEGAKQLGEARVAFETALATPGLEPAPQRFVRDRVRALAARSRR